MNPLLLAGIQCTWPGVLDIFLTINLLMIEKWVISEFSVNLRLSCSISGLQHLAMLHWPQEGPHSDAKMQCEL